ncbi:MAG: hypothetical protein PHQ12_12670 [Chthoniobacteraceae bacterium]|nr:hypothetical protein [Chthoniobacteraceae bacterium]
MNEIPPPPPFAFKDRKTSLTVFGVLTVLFGLLCALFTILLLGQAMAVQPTPIHQGALWMPCFLYAGLAVTLVWLGIGSIMARRWARALLVLFAWGALITGLGAMVSLALMSGKILADFQAVQPPGATPLPESAKTTILVIMGGFFAVIFVLLPATWAFFYSRSSVKATCEARDPWERWTDRCPLPVLAAVLFSLFGAASMLITAFGFHGAIPVFGVYLTGLPGILLYVVWAAVWAYCARALYRLDSLGWWLCVAILCVAALSAALTYHQQGVMEFYRLAGYSTEELARLQQLPFFTDNNAVWFILASSVPWLGYLLFLKRYFRRS